MESKSLVAFVVRMPCPILRLTSVMTVRICAAVSQETDDADVLQEACIGIQGRRDAMSAAQIRRSR